jgi:ubiquinone/menaquinone biosynthesis C-methylase UbiE
LDESAQMGRLAKRNLARDFAQKSDNNSTHQGSDYTQVSLARGIAQQLPFPNESFDTIVATFPTEYITDPHTLAEVKRCLSNEGRFIVLPAALPRNRFLDWLFKATHQSPVEAVDVVKAKFKEPFVEAGFRTEIEILEVKSGTLFIVLANK